MNIKSQLKSLYQYENDDKFSIKLIKSHLIEKDNKFKYSKKDFESEDFKVYIKRDINTIYGAVTIKDGEIVDEFGSIEEIKQFIDKDMED